MLFFSTMSAICFCLSSLTLFVSKSSRQSEFWGLTSINRDTKFKIISGFEYFFKEQGLDLIGRLEIIYQHPKTYSSSCVFTGFIKYLLLSSEFCFWLIQLFPWLPFELLQSRDVRQSLRIIPNCSQICFLPFKETSNEIKNATVYEIISHLQETSSYKKSGKNELPSVLGPI